jgi:hypothetical protein
MLGLKGKGASIVKQIGGKPWPVEGERRHG